VGFRQCRRHRLLPRGLPNRILCAGWRRDAESKLSPAERIALLTDIWASVRVGREPVGDYLALTKGLGGDRNRAVVKDILARLDYIGRYLVTDSDRESYRLWLREYFDAHPQGCGWEAKPGESDEQKMLRADVFTALGTTPAIRKRWRGLVSSQARLWKSLIVDRELADSAFHVAALTGDQAFYDKLMAALKNPNHRRSTPHLIYFGSVRGSEASATDS